MKPRNLLILILALLPGFTFAAVDAPLAVAVFDFDSRDEGVRDLGPKVASLVNANLSADPEIITVERSDLQKVLGETELGLSGTVSPDSAAKVGNLTGAKVLVTGRVFKADGELIIVAKIIGTETSRVYGELVRGGSRASIADLSEQLAKKIAADVTQKADTLIAHSPTPQQLIDKINAELGDKRRPSVSVHITEEHFGQVMIDPAAQTEFQVVLQHCGFPVVDEGSTNKAQIDLTGEAITEYGMRKGNLLTCRGRIELKARDHASGQLLLVDRQTCVGVDLAERIAAKTALQNGALELAERVIPQLAK